MENTGFDIGLAYAAKLSTDSRLSVDLHFSRYKNVITKVVGDLDFFYPNAQQGRIDNRFPVEININQIGSSISSFRGYQVAGIFRSADELASIDQPGGTVGGLRFKDLNNDGQINDADLDIIGSPHPDFTGGLNLGFSIKSFNISAFFVGSYGNEIFNYQKLFTHFRQFNSNVDREYYLNNGTGDIPALNVNDTGSRLPSDYFVEDGSYLRLGQLQLAYDLPKSIFRTGTISGLKVYVQAQNLFTITGYSGLDPVLSNANIGPGFTVNGNYQQLNDLWTGYDIGQYPSNKIFTFGVSADF